MTLLTLNPLHAAAMRRAHELRDQALGDAFLRLRHFAMRLLALCHLPRSVEA